MLVISRRVGECIQIGDGITITIVRVDARNVRLGIEAPGNASVVRQELIFPISPDSGARSAHEPPKKLGGERSP